MFAPSTETRKPQIQQLQLALPQSFISASPATWAKSRKASLDSIHSGFPVNAISSLPTLIKNLNRSGLELAESGLDLTVCITAEWYWSQDRPLREKTGPLASIL